MIKNNTPLPLDFDIDFFDADYDGVTSVLGCIMPNTISELVDKRDGFKHKNELIEVIKSNFELIQDDIFLVEDKINSYFLKDALSINFKFSGNHSSFSSMVWIV
jgi:hypothetical protein